ncbi:hypothetical protein D3C74_374680 [compost metagenome]
MKMIRIFEVHYELSNPDNFQTRIIKEVDWDTYEEKIKSGSAEYSSGLSLPRGATPMKLFRGIDWLEFDIIVPSNGLLYRCKSWKVHV